MDALLYRHDDACSAHGFCDNFCTYGVVLFARAYRTYRVRAVIGLIALAAVGYLYSTTLPASAGLGRIMNTLTGDNALAGDSRISIWADSLSRIVANPFGTGWGSFSINSYFSYPHNLLLEIGVEAGVVILAIIIALIAATLIKGAGVATDWQSTVMLCLFLFSLINALVSSDINGNRLLWVTGFGIWAVYSGSMVRTVGRHQPTRFRSRYRYAVHPRLRTMVASPPRNP